MKKAASFLLLSTGLILSTQAQDAIFSQHYANGNYINPALNGLDQEIKVSAHYRNQWVGSAANFTTYAANFELPIEKQNSSSIGIQLINDQAGNDILSTSSINFIYNYNLKINQEWQLRSGFQIGLGQQAFNSQGLIFEDQLDARNGNSRSSLEGVSNERKLYPDISVGFALVSKRFFTGFAVHHLNRPNVSFDLDRKLHIEPKYTLHSGLKIQNERSRHAYFSPNFILQQQGESTTLSLGNYFVHKRINGGIWYRMDQAVVLLIGIELEQFKVGYSTDLWLSEARGNGMTHEVSITAFINRPASKRVQRKTRAFCPSF